MALNYKVRCRCRVKCLPETETGRGDGDSRVRCLPALPLTCPTSKRRIGSSDFRCSLLKRLRYLFRTSPRLQDLYCILCIFLILFILFILFFQMILFISFIYFITCIGCYELLIPCLCRFSLSDRIIFSFDYFVLFASISILLLLLL